MDELTLQWRVLHCVRRVKEQADRELAPFCAANGLTMRALRVMMSLYVEGPMTASALAKRSCMAGANNSAVCKALAARGLILRERASDDERQVVISLSNTGRALMEQLETDISARSTLAGVGAEQLEQTLESLEKIVNALEQNKEKAV